MTAKWPVDLTKRFERFVTTALSIVNRVDKLCNRQIPIIYIYIFGNSFNCNCNVLLILSHSSYISSYSNLRELGKFGGVA